MRAPRLRLRFSSALAGRRSGREADGGILIFAVACVIMAFISAVVAIDIGTVIESRRSLSQVAQEAALSAASVITSDGTKIHKSEANKAIDHVFNQAKANKALIVSAVNAPKKQYSNSDRRVTVTITGKAPKLLLMGFIYRLTTKAQDDTPPVTASATAEICIPAANQPCVRPNALK